MTGRNGNHRRLIVAAVLCTYCGTVSADTEHYQQIVDKIESMPCGKSTVGESIKQEIMHHSRRDLGWQMFDNPDYSDMERTLRVSKSMDIRYRWRSSQDGKVEAISDAAKKLCTEQ